MFKVGQRVCVRKDLSADCTYDDLLFVSEMKSYIGKIVTITYAVSNVICNKKKKLLSCKSF